MEAFGLLGPSPRKSSSTNWMIWLESTPVNPVSAWAKLTSDVVASRHAVVRILILVEDVAVVCFAGRQGREEGAMRL